jgi:hypothetical protein
MHLHKAKDVIGLCSPTVDNASVAKFLCERDALTKSFMLDC